MRKFMYFAILLLTVALYGAFAVSPEDIENASALLGVPYDVLEELVEEYNEEGVASDAAPMYLSDLYSEFIRNGIKADMRYSGKEIAVGFTVEFLSAYNGYGWPDSGQYKYQIGGGSSSDCGLDGGVYFRCFPENTEAGKLMDVESGDYITAEGTCSVQVVGSIIYISLLGARITSGSPGF